MNLFGRKIIRSSVDMVTPDNVFDVLVKALGTHQFNAGQINYLWDYYKGNQPILARTKDVRPEITSKIVENRAYEIVSWKVAYLIGEPIQYVGRNGRDIEPLSKLNEMMFSEDKESKDQEIIEWQHVCGTAYRMVLPDPTDEDQDESPFHLYTLDPRDTFVIYSTDVDSRPLMAVKMCRNDTDGVVSFSCYTDDMCYRIKSDSNGEGMEMTSIEPHALGVIPIIEFPANRARLGAFEPVISLLDMLNTLDSNRLDGIEQTIQSFLKFINCDITADDFEAMRKMGAIKIKSEPGVNADVDVVTSTLDQTQAQTLKEDIYNTILTITGMPNRNGGSSTSDTGAAVVLRDGFFAAESRARDSETMFKRSERQMLKLVLRICEVMRGLTIKVKDIDIKFTRRYTDNILTKVQSLQGMLEAGIDSTVAISTCGLWSDPVDVALASAETLQKWAYRDPLEDIEDENPDEQDSESGDEE